MVKFKLLVFCIISVLVRLARRLSFLRGQLKEVQGRTNELLDKLTGTPEDDGEFEGEHRDAQILLSMPGVGRLVASTMLTEGSQPLKQRDYQVLRGRSGVAPVTRASGTRREVLMRRACSTRLRNAVYHMGRVAPQRDAAALAHYSALRKRGKSHGQATRSVADRLLRIMVAMLKNGTLYDPSRLRGRYSVGAGVS